MTWNTDFSQKVIAAQSRKDRLQVGAGDDAPSPAQPPDKPRAD
jgi:hypothetical protein